MAHVCVQIMSKMLLKTVITFVIAHCCVQILSQMLLIFWYYARNICTDDAVVL